jgi:hypothetical protein
MFRVIYFPGILLAERFHRFLDQEKSKAVHLVQLKDNAVTNIKAFSQIPIIYLLQQLSGLVSFEDREINTRERKCIS